MILGWVRQSRFYGETKGVALLAGPWSGGAYRRRPLGLPAEPNPFYWAGLTLVLFYGLLVGLGKGPRPPSLFPVEMGEEAVSSPSGWNASGSL